MIGVAARLLLAAVLLLAAGLKLAQPRNSAAAMSVYGARTLSAQWTLWAVAIGAELALAVGVAAGSETAAYLAGAMMLLFALMMIGALAAGRAGASCACFGPASRLSWTAVARNLVLAAAFACLPLLPQSSLTAEQWLGLGLAACFVGLIVLAITVLALAREIGSLRLRLPPGTSSALEIPDEGPALNEQVAWQAWQTTPGRARGETQGELRLAVFLSEGCHICHELEPQVRAFSRDPRISAELFDEVADAEAWQAFAVPGSPYAVACDLDGTALAKGTFNTLVQLESILATAERRRAAWASILPS